MIQNVTKSCRELAKYVRIKETLLNAAGVARGSKAGGTRWEGGGGKWRRWIFEGDKMSTDDGRKIKRKSFVGRFFPPFLP